MSQEIVEIARELNMAFRRGDWGAVAKVLDPDVLVRTDPRWPEQRIYGGGPYLAFMRSTTELWGSDARIEEMVDLGDRLLIRLAWSTSGDHSGVKGTLDYSELVTYREGRVIFIEMFLDHADALKAVGLE